MNTTEIVWTEKTWNPVSGCHAVSPGCAYCYARTLAEQKRGTVAFPVGFDVVLKPHKLNEPKRLKTPSLIFVNSMSDLFLDEIPDEYRERILDVIRATPQHTYQTLTKRPEGAARFAATHELPSNLWLGATVEDQARRTRIDVLRTIKASVRFLSIEPMLSAIDLGDLRGIGWVIVGGESGSHLLDPAVCQVRGLVRRERDAWVPRGERADWVRSIRDQCKRAGVPFLFKQWGGSRGPIAGRMLDGQIWDQYPPRGQALTPVRASQTSLF
jgi:protein gp37